MRLHQRIGITDSDVVLREIYSVAKGCAKMLEAAKKVGAYSCPLLSKNGIFVTVPPKDSTNSSLITWMPFHQLSQKWGVVANDLREISTRRPDLLDDYEFLVAYLKSNAWMLRPHQPSVDMETIAWNQLAVDSSKLNTVSTAPIVKEYLVALENDLDISAQEKNHDVIIDEHEELIPQTPSLQNTLPFKEFDRLDGIVVRQTQTGYLIVSLLDGWLGSIRPSGLDRAYKIIDGLVAVKIGDKVSVVVRKIFKNNNTSALGVSLDLSEKAVAEWSLVASKYPIGEIVECRILRQIESRCILKLDDGVIAEMPKKEFSWSNDINFKENIFLPGKIIKAMILGTHKSKKHLLVSKRLAIKNPWDSLVTRWLPGKLLPGIIYKANGDAKFIRLPSGVDGEIKKYNFRAGESIRVGQTVKVQVLKVCPEKAKVSLILASVNEQDSKFIPYVVPTLKEWEGIQIDYPVGTIVEGQVCLFYDEGTLIKVARGVNGYLPDLELSWTRKNGVAKGTLKTDQFLTLVVTQLNHLKKNLGLSHRQITPDPWEMLDLTNDEAKEYKGVAVNIVDFGIFIQIYMGIDGLLHKSEMPPGWQCEIGQTVEVIVKSYDMERKRIELALAIN